MIEIIFGLEAQLVELVLDDWLLDKANLAPATRVCQDDNTWVRIIKSGSDGILTIIIEAKAERVSWTRSTKTGARIRLLVNNVAIGC